MRTSEQQARYDANRRAKAAAAAIAAGREPGRNGRPPTLSVEQKEASRLAQNRKASIRARKRRSAVRAAKALAEGRTPGKPGPKRILTDEQREQSLRDRAMRHKRKNLDGVRERNKLFARKFRKENPAITAAHSRNRRARERGASGSHTAADIAALREKQHDTCTYCMQRLGDATVHVDHHIPLALGGSNDPDNLRLLHSTCNLMKGARHPAERALSQRLCW